MAEIKIKRGRNACFGDEVAKGTKCLFRGRSGGRGRSGRGRSDTDGDEMTVFWGTKWQGDEMTLNRGGAAGASAERSKLFPMLWGLKIAR